MCTVSSGGGSGGGNGNGSTAVAVGSSRRKKKFKKVFHSQIEHASKKIKKRTHTYICTFIQQLNREL